MSEMFNQVLVGVDGRQGGRDAVALATELAAPEAEITLMHVYGTEWMLGREAGLALALEHENSEKMLADARDAADIDARLVAQWDSGAARGLLGFAEQSPTDLLVIGSCHRGLLGRVFVGDQTNSALNGSPCAVAIAPLGYAAAPHTFSAIGIGHDGSAESDRALAAIRELAARHGSTIRAMSVVSLDNFVERGSIPENWREHAADEVDAQRDRLARLSGVMGDACYGDPADELLHFARSLDLLAIGSRSYGPIGRLYHGSVSRSLARRVTCPLLVMPRNAVQAPGESGDAASRDEPVITNA